jgi:SAM-dependent methyltransferase
LHSLNGSPGAGNASAEVLISVSEQRSFLKMNDDAEPAAGTSKAELREAQLNGKALYGDDLGSDELRVWYEKEENAYIDLRNNFYATTNANDQYDYEYQALNDFHAISFLLNRRFGCCVALGCAAGDDVTPLAPVVDRFVAIEPAERWWRTEIGGKPATYLKPQASGNIDLPSTSADLATSLGVLHHIPNVTHVVSEIARILRPRGLFIVREPISWMGDWRRPRAGLTANERGLPVTWFEHTVRSAGFTVVRRHLCMFRAVALLATRLGVPSPYNSRAVTVVDWLVSEALRWNARYRRDMFVKKIAPGSAFWILERT